MVELMRSALTPLYRAANNAHPGLLIQRGYSTFDDVSEAGKSAKSAHIARICDSTAGDFYKNAYARWQRATADRSRFYSAILKLDTRLFIGLTGGGMLETGCAMAHSYGAPYIPGSSVKGVVNAHVRRSPFGQERRVECDEVFGAEPSKANPLGLSGVVSFHDAWWVPASAAKPLVQEVVTTHHLDYYGSEGTSPATDLDSPVPNAQIAVRGSFLFVIEGPRAWTQLAGNMLMGALSTSGVGAKTRAGHGYFDWDERENAKLQETQEAHLVALLPKEQQLRELAKKLKPKELAETFGPDINKTKLARGEDFDLYRTLVLEEQRALLDSWKDATRQTDKAKWKAHRNLIGGES